MVFLERHSKVLMALGVALIALLAVMGVVQRFVQPDLGWFNLDGEHNVPSATSAAVLGLCALAVVALIVRDARPWAPWGLLALFTLMSVDEVFMLHERLESALGVDWQTLYAPVIALGGLAFLATAWRHRRDRPFVIPWLAGAAAWVVSQLLERWATDDNDVALPYYDAKMVAEEILELTGSALFLAALCYLLVRRARRAR